MPTFVLLSWPLVSIILFRALGRPKGLVWSVVVGFLLLPEAFTFDFPALPPFGKPDSIALGALLGVLCTRDMAEPRPMADPFVRGLLTAILLLLIAAPFATMLTNRDGFVIGLAYFAPVTLWDVQSHLVDALIWLVPFFLARRYLYSPQMHREVLKGMVAAALFYALLALYEVRMSPQLNSMFYGYFPHAWNQHIRPGGFRPVVFLNHGLELGFFLMTAVLAAIGLFRTARRETAAIFFCAGLFLFAVLSVSQNLGGLVLCVLFGAAAFLLTFRIHIRIAVVVAILFTLYPLTRDAYIQPLLAAAERVSEDRHGSLEFRFNNEDLLVERAFERPLAGWGPRGRWTIHDERGEGISVSDGIWIIELGKWGWMGFLGLFGLVMAPLFLMCRAARALPPDKVTTVMVLMVAANLIYMIPNSTLSPVGWLVIGALAGYVQFAPDLAARAAEDETSDTAPGRRRRSAYTRFGSNHVRGSSAERRYSRFSPGE